MIKRQDKSQRDIPIAPDESRHKKKKNSKGLARSNHKHQYETVLLHRDYTLTKPHDVNPFRIKYDSATKVCKICGKISLTDDSYYMKIPSPGVKNAYQSVLIPEAYELEHWYTNDFFGKFAHKQENE